MKLTDIPALIQRAWANAGGKNTIPNSGGSPGQATWDTGFPPLTMTPLAAGGIPPSGLDMNGGLFALSAVLRWISGGGGMLYDAAYVAQVGGYPKGAKLLNNAGTGYFINQTDDNSTDPNAGGANWTLATFNGIVIIPLSNANVTLAPAQYGCSIIVLTGALAANLTLTFPAIPSGWQVINKTTGSFAVSAKANGSAVAAAQLATGANGVVIDGIDAYLISGAGGGAVGGGTDKVFYENDTTVNNSYTISTGKNAVSAGPITIAGTAVVTIPTGSTWTIP